VDDNKKVRIRRDESTSPEENLQSKVVLKTYDNYRSQKMSDQES
jgi:hypothetical protein